jgi:hypothetical protein
MDFEATIVAFRAAYVVVSILRRASIFPEYAKVDWFRKVQKDGSKVVLPRLQLKLDVAPSLGLTWQHALTVLPSQVGINANVTDWPYEVLASRFLEKIFSDLEIERTRHEKGWFEAIKKLREDSYKGEMDDKAERAIEAMV